MSSEEIRETAEKLIRMTENSAGPVVPWMNVLLPKADVILVARAALTAQPDTSAAEVERLRKAMQSTRDMTHELIRRTSSPDVAIPLHNVAASLTMALSAGPREARGDEAERCPECHTADRAISPDYGGTCVVCWRRRNGEIPPRIPIEIKNLDD